MSSESMKFSALPVCFNVEKSQSRMGPNVDCTLCKWELWSFHHLGRTAAIMDFWGLVVSWSLWFLFCFFLPDCNGWALLAKGQFIEGFLFFLFFFFFFILLGIKCGYFWQIVYNDLAPRAEINRRKALCDLKPHINELLTSGYFGPPITWFVHLFWIARKHSNHVQTFE